MDSNKNVDSKLGDTKKSLILGINIFYWYN